MSNHTAKLQIVDKREAIKQSLVDELERLTERVNNGEIDGFVVVMQGQHVESYGHFTNRFEMAGALHYALSSLSGGRLG